MLGKMIKFRNYQDVSGKLTCFEDTDLDFFQVKRIFYIYGVPSHENRGNHACRNSDLIMIPINGEVTVQLTDGINTEVYLLNDKCIGLYVSKMIWIIARNFTEDAVLFVLSQEDYTNAKYIDDYNEYIKVREKNL